MHNKILLCRSARISNNSFTSNNMASTTFEIKERWHRLSDKTVCHTFYSIVDGKRVECSVPECDFELVYFNPKQPQSKIVCGRIGEEWRNCGPVSGSTNQVLCYLSLSRYNIPEGELFCMVRLLSSDQNFLNSLKISQEPSFTLTKLIAPWLTVLDTTSNP